MKGHDGQDMNAWRQFRFNVGQFLIWLAARISPEWRVYLYESATAAEYLGKQQQKRREE